MSRTTPPFRQRGAFSLIEVTVAIGVIAFALVAIIGVFPIGISSDRSNISETRAAQLANAVIASIDAQCDSFTTIDCFGLALDLASLNNLKDAAPTTALLYAKYPAGYQNNPLLDQPQISTDATNAIYTIELRFDNNPALATGVTLGTGKISQIQILVRGQTASTNPITFHYLARNKR